jgi:hypothetical protein
MVPGSNYLSREQSRDTLSDPPDGSDDLIAKCLARSISYSGEIGEADISAWTADLKISNLFV